MTGRFDELLDDYTQPEVVVGFNDEPAEWTSGSEDTGATGAPRSPSPTPKLDFSAYDVDYQNIKVEPHERVLRELCGAKAMIAGLRSESAPGLSRLRRGAAADPGNPGDEDADACDSADDDSTPQTAGADVEVVLVNSPVYVYIKLKDAAAVFSALRKEHPAV